MAVLALIGAVAAFLLMQRWRGGLVVAKHQPHSAGDGGDTIPPE
jgi:hypothetical protein